MAAKPIAVALAVASSLVTYGECGLAEKEHKEDSKQASFEVVESKFSAFIGTYKHLSSMKWEREDGKSAFYCIRKANFWCFQEEGAGPNCTYSKANQPTEVSFDNTYTRRWAKIQTLVAEAKLKINGDDYDRVWDANQDKHPGGLWTRHGGSSMFYSRRHDGKPLWCLKEGKKKTRCTVSTDRPTRIKFNNVYVGAERKRWPEIANSNSTKGNLKIDGKEYQFRGRFWKNVENNKTSYFYKNGKQWCFKKEGKTRCTLDLADHPTGIKFNNFFFKTKRWAYISLREPECDNIQSQSSCKERSDCAWTAGACKGSLKILAKYKMFQGNYRPNQAKWEKYPGGIWTHSSGVSFYPSETTNQKKWCFELDGKTKCTLDPAGHPTEIKFNNELTNPRWAKIVPKARPKKCPAGFSAQDGVCKAMNCEEHFDDRTCKICSKLPFRNHPSNTYYFIRDPEDGLCKMNLIINNKLWKHYYQTNAPREYWAPDPPSSIKLFHDTEETSKKARWVLLTHPTAGRLFSAEKTAKYQPTKKYLGDILTFDGFKIFVKDEEQNKCTCDSDYGLPLARPCHKDAPQFCRKCISHNTAIQTSKGNVTCEQSCTCANGDGDLDIDRCPKKKSLQKCKVCEPGYYLKEKKDETTCEDRLCKKRFLSATGRCEKRGNREPCKANARVDGTFGRCMCMPNFKEEKYIGRGGITEVMCVGKKEGKEEVQTKKCCENQVGKLGEQCLNPNTAPCKDKQICKDKHYYLLRKIEGASCEACGQIKSKQSEVCGSTTNVKACKAYFAKMNKLRC